MAEKQIILVPDFLTVRELATLIDASPIDVMKKLIANGIMASINQQIDFDTAAIVVEDLGFEAQSASAAAAAGVCWTRETHWMPSATSASPCDTAPKLLPSP